MKLEITEEDVKNWKKLDAKCDNEIVKKEILRLKNQGKYELICEILDKTDWGNREILEFLNTKLGELGQ